MSISSEELKKVAIAAIDAAAVELAELSDDIWRHPELKYEEKHAHQVNMVFVCKRYTDALKEDSTEYFFESLSGIDPVL